MPKTLTQLFRDEAAKDEQSPLYHLFTIEIPNTTDFYFCDSNEDLVYNGITYIKFPCKFNGIEITGDGSLQKASISIANVDRLMEGLVEEYDGLRGLTLRVKTVYAKFLDAGESPSTSSHSEEVYVIDAYSSNESAITFTLELLTDFTIKIPRRKYLSFGCGFKYKDSISCKYLNNGVAIVTGTNTIRVVKQVTTNILNREITVGSTPVPSTTTQVVTVTAVTPYDTYYDTITVNTTLVFPQTTIVVTSYTTCEKTLKDCKSHNNSINFGGFPGIPNNIRRIYF